MSTQYVCQNCQELYKPPRRKDGLCKTCNDAATVNVNARKEKHDVETEVLKQLQASELEMLKHKQAAELEMLKARQALQLQNARTIALLKRYQPPSTNNNLRILR